MDTIYLFIASLSLFGLSEAAECYRDSLFGYSYYEYCVFGCCGYSSYGYCCTTTWPVIGIVIGVGFVVAVIVTVVCCCRRSRGNAGMVCQPRPGATTTVVTAGQYQPANTVVTYPAQPAGYTTGYTAGYQQPGYQQPGYQQPGYQQPGYQQPGYQTQPQGYPSYPPTSQAGYVGSSSTTYTGQPETKAASAPPMEPPPPYQ